MLWFYVCVSKHSISLGKKSKQTLPMKTELIIFWKLRKWWKQSRNKNKYLVTFRTRTNRYKSILSEINFIFSFISDLNYCSELECDRIIQNKLNSTMNGSWWILIDSTIECFPNKFLSFMNSFICQCNIFEHFYIQIYLRWYWFSFQTLIEFL